MKPILIKEENRERINEALAKGQGKAKVRCLDGYDDLVELVEDAKDRLPDQWVNRKNSPKTCLDGVLCHYRIGAEGHFPNAYQYSPKGTVCDLRFRADGQVSLVHVCREDIRNGRVCSWKFPPKTFHRMMSFFNIHVDEDREQDSDRD